jgi:HEAT repeat protein
MGLVKQQRQVVPALRGPSTPPLERLADPIPDVRRAAARELVGAPGGLVALSARVPVEPDRGVLDLLLTLLVERPSRAVVVGLLPALSSDDARLRGAVAEALEQMPQPLEAEIGALLEHADPDLRLQAVVALQHAPIPSAPRLLRELLAREPLVNICAAALEGLAEVGEDTDLPVVEAVRARFPEVPFLDFAATVCVARLRGGHAR